MRGGGKDRRRKERKVEGRGVWEVLNTEKRKSGGEEGGRC